MPERGPSSRRAFVSTAADTDGNLAGVGLGVLFAGPEGAVAGAMVGPSVALAIRQAVEQIGGWVGGRQADRVSETIRVAASDIEQHLSEGRKISAAFADAGNKSSAAEEIAEGVLQIAAFSYEQRKATYLGHLLASVAVRDDISVADAHRLTRLVGSLSYRQLACLAGIGNGPTEVPTITAAVVMVMSKNETADGVADEINELTNTHRLFNSKGTLADEAGTAKLPAAARGDGKPSLHIGLTTRGWKLFELLRLDTVPEQDRRDVVAEMSSAIEELEPPHPPPR
jgi:hypothetical protein